MPLFLLIMTIRILSGSISRSTIRRISIFNRDTPIQTYSFPNSIHLNNPSSNSHLTQCKLSTNNSIFSNQTNHSINSKISTLNSSNKINTFNNSRGRGNRHRLPFKILRWNSLEIHEMRKVKSLKWIKKAKISQDFKRKSRKQAKTPLSRHIQLWNLKLPLPRTSPSNLSLTLSYSLPKSLSSRRKRVQMLIRKTIRKLPMLILVLFDWFSHYVNNCYNSKF